MNQDTAQVKSSTLLKRTIMEDQENAPKTMRPSTSTYQEQVQESLKNVGSRQNLYEERQEGSGESICQYIIEYCFHNDFKELPSGDGVKDIDGLSSIQLEGNDNDFSIGRFITIFGRLAELPAGFRLTHNIYKHDRFGDVSALCDRIIERASMHQVYIVGFHQGGPSEHFHVVHDCPWRNREC